MKPNITHLGGENTVTGSCHLLQANGLNIVVDCGLAQGNDAVLPMKSWPVEPGEIDYLFLTHAHIDHIGRVPELIERGFSGEIICSHPTKALLIPMLRDALSFTDKSDKQVQRLEKIIDELSWGFEYREKFQLKKGIAFKLGCAGHPLKGPCQEKTPLHCKKNSFFTGTQRRIQPKLAKYPFVCALFFNWFWLRSVFDLHQAPIRIKAVIKTVRVAQWRALKWLGTEQPFPF